MKKHQHLDCDFEFVLVGAGLANCLAALKLAEQGRRFIIIEKKSKLEPLQTWSFHLSDLTSEELEWLLPLITAQWPGYEVRFPSYHRFLKLPYASICSSGFFQHVQKVIGKHILTSQEIKIVTGKNVELSSGKKISGRCIIDSRGLGQTQKLPTGLQKFVGLEIKFSQPHGLKHPRLMDATVAQKEGFRFLYTLPLDEKTLLVEDTRYSDTARIESDDFEREILAYVHDSWGEKFEIARRESAALQIPLMWQDEDMAALALGLRGGYFHPTTGYSLPWAVRNAFFISSFSEPSTDKLRLALRARDKSWIFQRQYFLFLNRMLFGAAVPTERIKIFSRFYTFAPDFISRFYSGKFTYTDQARLLFGVPPVKISRALRSLFSRSWMESFPHV
ncbi:MAG: hypothetical protein A4S09_10075 [Proteobacteria bacterium SG_bin7]|nr:MAG: hypothetical protein A4S09_10075 [Proteobacteria bacterium SG_bin7]